LAQIDNNIFYSRVISKFGLSSKGVHWSSRQNQYKRFEVLTGFIDENIKDSFIIDAGCGMGEYYKYLKQNRKLPKRYIGIDCEDSMVNISRIRLPKIEFYKKNILKDRLAKCDYYVASGSLNVLNDKEIYQFINRCFEVSQRGFVFNFLNIYDFNTIDSGDILEHCKKMAKEVKIKTGYLNSDFTFFLIK
jgi:ubiquinone/menaquinone biosynthesis C-methylase UbiE